MSHLDAALARPFVVHGDEERARIVACLRSMAAQEQGGDIEALHGEADDLLCALLRWHGEDVAVDAFMHIEKWYA